MQQEAGQKHMKNMMQKTINIKMSRLQCSAAAILWSSHLLLLWWDPGPVYHPGVTRGVEWLGKLARHRTTAHNTKKQKKTKQKHQKDQISQPPGPACCAFTLLHPTPRVFVSMSPPSMPSQRLPRWTVCAPWAVSKTGPGTAFIDINILFLINQLATKLHILCNSK